MSARVGHHRCGMSAYHFLLNRLLRGITALPRPPETNFVRIFSLILFLWDEDFASCDVLCSLYKAPIITAKAPQILSGDGDTVRFSWITSPNDWRITDEFECWFLVASLNILANTRYCHLSLNASNVLYKSRLESHLARCESVVCSRPKGNSVIDLALLSWP